MKADLHVHTNISDGSMGTYETIMEAEKRGVTHLGIVNHDTQRGLEEAIEIGKKLGVKVIPGVEISAYDYVNKRGVHVLGYNCNLYGKNVNKICNQTLERKYENSIWQMNQLINSGYPIDALNILTMSKHSQVIYKQHIMKDLIEKKYTDEIYSKLYTELFKDNGICDRDIEYVDVFEAIRAIKADGGIAILAHPGQTECYDIIEELILAGLDGIELYHEQHTQKDYELIYKLMDKYNLILTGGSDFHGDYGSSSVQIGDITSPVEYLHFFDNNLNPLKSKKSGTCDEVLMFTEKIVREVGTYLKGSVKYPLILEYKDDNIGDIVTKYDREVEGFLINKIKEHYPSHTFITEENTCDNQCFTEYTWIIDPIDGTTNFVNLGRDYAVSIALYINKRPYLGVVYDVRDDKMYSGVVGKGAYLNGIRLNKLNEKLVLKDALLDISLNTVNRMWNKYGVALWEIIKQVRGHRSYGSASLSICKIATGELNGYISTKLYLWDYAAAIIVLNEVGGYFNFFEDEIERYPLSKVSFLSTSNSKIHSELTNILTCLELNTNFTHH